MSFFKKLTDEFKGLKTKDDKGNQDAGPIHRGDTNAGQSHGYTAPGHQQYSYGEPQPAYGQQYPSQQQQYSHDQSQSPYGHQQHGYGAPSMSYSATGNDHGQAQYGAPGQSQPSLPPGWQIRYDQATDRSYYVTVLSQWEPPMGVMASSASYFPAPPGEFAPFTSGTHSDASRGMFGAGNYGHNNANMSHGGGPYHDQGQHKDDGNKKMMMGAAGGLAVGAAGAYAIHEMTEDEHGNPVPTGSAYDVPPQTTGVGEGAPSAALPATDADGDSVSSSHREDVQEARADYEDAVASGSQSDVEEAREEYQEEYEETYDD